MKTKITFLKATFLVAGLFIASSVSAQTLEAHYKFDGDLTDASGNSRTLYINGWTLDTDIAFNGGVAVKVGTHGLDATTIDNGTSLGSFLRTEDGSGAPVAAPASLTGNSARTITAWIKISDATSARAIAGLGSTANNERFDLLVKTGGNIRCEKAGSGFEGTSVADGFWNFVAVTYDQAAAKLYVSTGPSAVTEAGTTAWMNIATTATGPIMVANGAQSNRSLFGGIDDVRFYSGALTKTQLEDIMGGGTLGVNDIAFGADELKAYPNAVTDFLNIETSVSENLEITIYNTLGKLVDRTNGTRVDMSDLSSGLYIVNVRAGAKVASLKIFKK